MTCGKEIDTNPLKASITHSVSDRGIDIALNATLRFLAEERMTLAARMPEAEVTLGVAFWLLDSVGPHSHADVAIDGANVRIAALHSGGSGSKGTAGLWD